MVQFHKVQNHSSQIEVMYLLLDRIKESTIARLPVIQLIPQNHLHLLRAACKMQYGASFMGSSQVVWPCKKHCDLEPPSNLFLTLQPPKSWRVERTRV